MSKMHYETHIFDTHVVLCGEEAVLQLHDVAVGQRLHDLQLAVLRKGGTHIHIQIVLFETKIPQKIERSVWDTRRNGHDVMRACRAVRG